MKFTKDEVKRIQQECYDSGKMLVEQKDGIPCQSCPLLFVDRDIYCNGMGNAYVYMLHQKKEIRKREDYSKNILTKCAEEGWMMKYRAEGEMCEDCKLTLRERGIYCNEALKNYRENIEGKGRKEEINRILKLLEEKEKLNGGESNEETNK